MFVITGMGRGGAEVQAKGLAKRLVSRGHQVMLVALMPFEDFEQELRDAGVETRTLGMRRGRPNLRAVGKLTRIVLEWHPELIQTWLYAADVLGGLVAWMTRAPVAWGIRSSVIHASRKQTQALMRVSARLSRSLPRRIFVNSEAGRRTHAALGYRADRMLVIHNGFDVDTFRPDPMGRTRVRAELGLHRDTPVVGIVARFDPLKDFGTFFRAAGLLHCAMPEARFMVVGRDLANNPLIARYAREANVADACILTGQRADIPRLNNSFDLATLTSTAEGFPNAIGEAMACGVPCVSTDAGDAAALIGDAGVVVPVGDAERLAAEWRRLLTMPKEERRRLGDHARRRIVECFSDAAVTARYECEWAKILRELG